MRVGVIGTGYVGLVTGACLAEKGNEVTCVDNNLEKVERLRAGNIPIFEPGLEELVIRNVHEGNLSFSTQLGDGVDDTDVTFLALPTPEAEDGSADLRHVLEVAEEIGKFLREYGVIVTKSTVPPGTAKKVHEKLSLHADPKLFDVASNPEFLKEGAAIQDFQHPDRIVVGVESDKAWDVLRELYLPFVPTREEKLMRVSIVDAEIIKYAANTMLAARVALVNEIANITGAYGGDIRSVMRAVGADVRIGELFLNPGPGYGGSCFPKDVQALNHAAGEVGFDARLIHVIHESNKQQKGWLFERVRDYFGEKLDGKRIAIWGLSFKSRTDDIRETPAIDLIDSLIAAKAKVVAYDPKAMDNLRQRYGSETLPYLTFAESRYEVLNGADALVIVTDWDEFKTPTWKRIKEAMNAPVIFDARSLYDPKAMQRRGFYYESIGRGVVNV